MSVDKFSRQMEAIVYFNFGVSMVTTLSNVVRWQVNFLLTLSTLCCDFRCEGMREWKSSFKRDFWEILVSTLQRNMALKWQMKAQQLEGLKTYPDYFRSIMDCSVCVFIKLKDSEFSRCFIADLQTYGMNQRQGLQSFIQSAWVIGQVGSEEMKRRTEKATPREWRDKQIHSSTENRRPK